MENAAIMPAIVAPPGPFTPPVSLAAPESVHEGVYLKLSWSVASSSEMTCDNVTVCSWIGSTDDARHPR
jgi:hypothetical protein